MEGKSRTRGQVVYFYVSRATLVVLMSGLFFFFCMLMTLRENEGESERPFFLPGGGTEMRGEKKSVGCFV